MIRLGYGLPQRTQASAFYGIGDSLDEVEIQTLDGLIHFRDVYRHTEQFIQATLPSRYRR